VVNTAKEVLDIQVNRMDVTRLPQLLNPSGRRVGASSRAETVAVIEEQFFEDRSQLLRHSLLTYSLRNTGNPEWSEFPFLSRLGNVNPPYGHSAAAVLNQFTPENTQVLLLVGFPLGNRDSIDSRGSAV
jgi:hypothetical protein